ncbi:MAG: SH3 domain-containing protein [Anaerolineae bacterium]|nr:SH3 domain-containing protein [Anaerolineae bacterium]
MIALAIGWYFINNTPPPSGPLPTAILWTVTPTQIPTITPTPILPTAAPTPVEVQEQLRIGAQVQILGTGGAGLSLRSGPGQDYERLDIGQEGESFIIVSGPEQTDEWIWWKLRDETNPQREGWAVANYLSPIN